MKKILVLLSLAALVLSGCNKEKIELRNKGKMSISVSSEGEFTTPGTSSAPGTPGTKADEVDIKEFAITIKNAQTGAQVQSWDKYSQVPSVIAMDPAAYIISATSPGTKDVAWNQPVYKGSQDFTVEAGKVVNIDLTCKLKNMKVTIKCTDRFFQELNPDFTITVTTDFGFLVYTKEIIELGTAGFFSVAPLQIFIQGTRVKDPSKVVNQLVKVTNVAERDHHVFTIDAKETGEVQIGENGIKVDYSVNNKDVDIIVDGFEEDPIEDDNTGTPVLQSASILSGAVVDKTLGSITLTYSVPVKLAEGANITMGDVTLTKSASGKVVTLTFGTLAPATNYSLNVAAGAVLNAADNTPAALYTLPFSTKSEGTTNNIVITSLGIDSPVSYPFGASGVTFNIDIAAPDKIEELWFDIQSESLKAIITGMGNSTKVDLAHMSPEEEEFYGGLFGLTSADVYGKTQKTFSIGSFIGLMPEGTHPFLVTVKDQKGAEKSATITIIITPAS